MRGEHAVDARVLIVGTGFGGLGAAIQLARRGERDFLLLERAGNVGGTWRDNTYPGCACDVHSHLYAFSFAPNPDWSRTFSPQPEIQRYLERCAREFDILPHVRFGHTMHSARWDEAGRRWIVETSQGVVTGRVLVLATGPLSEPAVPALPGLERFAGTAFHSARWDHAHDLTGRRVAVVGTGASAVQFVPAIQPGVERLTLFQRTPAWVMPRRDRVHTLASRRLFGRVPGAQRLVRGTIWTLRELMLLPFVHPRLAPVVEAIARRHLRQAVADPVLRAKLTPTFAIGCKRVLVSDDYLPALARPNVSVVTEPIAEVRAHAVVTADGVEHPADTIVFGTGFRVTDPPFAPYVRGRDGRSLAEAWGASPAAHLGTTVAGFPNLFVLLGPNTGLGHTSVVLMLEAQIDHLLGALDHLARTGAAALEPRPEAQAGWLADVDRRMQGTVWVTGGCRSWYLDATGRNSTLWPDHTWRYRRRVARFDAGEYVSHQAASRASEPAGDWRHDPARGTT
jgi:cation diffusion facilitator CzcD-associated flavoprotein CzcO